ncbi:hypothetical protein L1887_14595 [Cichorium endivia]|nr:hypothetical protein L1887_14595 [Cichorium endivia]
MSIYLSISKSAPFTPAANNSLVACEDINLPPELDVDCIHGFKLGTCPEAITHLQDLKDMLISISNDLIDNVSEFDSDQVEKLCEDRLQLKKQIQLLKQYCQSILMDDEGCKSSFSAYTSTRDFKYQTPLAFTSRIDPIRLDDQFGYNKWDPPSISCSSVGNFGIFSTPMEREPYVRKNVKVNYIDGSDDKKWSKKDFPWTKKLETNNKKVFGNHSFRPNQREVINATMSGNDVFVLMLEVERASHISYLLLYVKANIPAAYLSSNMEWIEQQEILRYLCSGHCSYKLLYVTPEKVAKPDYQSLGILKQNFPNIPLLALTATATASVKEDVVQALGLVDCIIFRQSFNRPNLRIDDSNGKIHIGLSVVGGEMTTATTRDAGGHLRWSVAMTTASSLLLVFFCGDEETTAGDGGFQ